MGSKNIGFYKFIATGFGSGYSPVAPGTAGALVALVLWLIGGYFLSSTLLLIFTVICIVLFGVVGVIATDKVIPHWGEDPSKVVVDEMVGVWIPLLIANFHNVYTYILAFVLFRLFDIFKPLGIRKMEDFKGGLGVMLDDVLAGLYSLLVLFLIKWLFF